MKKRFLPLQSCLVALLLAGCGESVRDEIPVQTLPEYASVTGDTITLSKDALEVTLTPDMGGRISALHYSGEPVIIAAADTGNPNGWGNVFWPSPQSNWGWPPLATIDSESYQVSVRENQVVLTSAREPRTQLVVEKRYGFGEAEDVLRIHYRVTNAGESNYTLAPWEVTRVPSEGLAFFPRGESAFISGSFDPLPVVETDGVVWYAMGNVETHGPNNHKLMTDGREGWLAWLRNSTLMVKTFADVPAELMAPGEGEIEIYTNAGHTYVELEQQGFLATLEPGESLDWTVNWVFEQVDPDLKTDRQALVRKAQALAARAPVQ